MSNADKLQQAFSRGLGIEADRIVDELQYDGIPEWDSVAHMTLIAVLEDCFDIMLDTDDIIDMSSVLVAKQIISRHGIEFD